MIMINEMEEKVFFNAGDTVILKQELTDKPIMIVKEINKAVLREPTPMGGKRGVLFGITCFWFTKNNEYQSSQFNTKDLVHYEQ